MRAAARAIADPAEIVGRDRVPAVDRHAPVLSSLAERIRWHADRGVEHEERLVGPDVGAVAVDHERQIAEQTDALRVCGGARLLPLRVGLPLQVLVEQDVVGELEPRLRQGVRPSIAHRLGPVGPRPLVLTGVNRTEQRVVVQPPRLLGGVGLERLGAFGAAAPLAFEKLSEGRRERALLQRPDRLVVHARRRLAPARAARDRRDPALASPPKATNSGTAATRM